MAFSNSAPGEAGEAALKRQMAIYTERPMSLIWDEEKLSDEAAKWH